ncbi:unnamed protein product [Phytophthora lilii]|uniref:Unnamed protein product n=1 Tax=Phytophthora lilii TaxID=2077276 RepID=A0A9W6U0Z5_9STRA|nr:unnamed protein product [Phytophthora lilii]
MDPSPPTATGAESVTALDTQRRVNHRAWCGRPAPHRKSYRRHQPLFNLRSAPQLPTHHSLSMLSYFDEVPTSTSLLMQCGYRSKVCTNHRATKLDGTLHKLCEFHRRKANLNQQRLHKRQREKRAALQQCEPKREPVKEYEQSDRLAKRARLTVQPIPYISSDGYYYQCGANDSSQPQQASPVGPSEFAFQRMGSQDMDILELLLLDMQSLPPLETFLPSASSSSSDDKNSIIV